MPIAVICLSCKNKLQAPDTLAGKKAKCPKCGTLVQVDSPLPDMDLDHHGLAGHTVSSTVGVDLASQAENRTVLAQPEGMIRYTCPRCKRSLESPASFAGQKLNCPGCSQRLQIPQRSALPSPPVQETAAAAAVATALPSGPEAIDVEPAAPALTGAKRLLSLPWLLLVFVFGFLPWSEVSCSSKDFHWRLGQSGYQAVYGGISSPFDSMEVAQDAALKEASTNKRELTKRIENERSDYLMACSPFLVVFWVTALIMLLCFFLIPLSKVRLAIGLALAGLMLTMLVITLVAGMPLERRIDRAVQQAIKSDPESGMIMVAALQSGKTFWFWLVFAAVLLIGAAEAVANALWRTFELVRLNLLVVIGSLAAFIIITGVGAQAMAWAAGMTAMEARVAQLQKAEQEKTRKLAEAENAKREQERQAEAKRQADLRKQREENAAREKALLQERERQRLEQERHRLEKEQKDRELREEQEREAAELAKKKAAEAKRKLEEEMKLEAERKQKQEAREKAASEPLDRAKKLLREDDAYKNDNAIEAWAILEKLVKEWPDTKAAAEAKRLLPPVKSAKEQERDEQDAGERLTYARKLIKKGDEDEARERLGKILKEYPGTNAAADARKELRRLGK